MLQAFTSQYKQIDNLADLTSLVQFGASNKAKGVH